MQEIFAYAEDPGNTKLRNSITVEAISAFEQELKRVNYRLSLLKTRALADIASEMNQMFNLYGSLSHQIEDRLNFEKLAVKRLCTILTRCVEREERIQPTLMLEQSGFTVHPSLIMFPDDELPSTPPIEEPCPIEGFRVGQLGKLKDLLMGVAPLGIISERAFIYILADLIALIGFDVPGHSKLPQSWAKLTPPEIECLVERICGRSVGISWKDFILYNLEIRFPSMTEILIARQAFQNMDPDNSETISRENYDKFKFWFEAESPPETPYERLKLCLTRELILCLFEIAPDVIDYSGLLLSFCKDTDPRIGFAKAIALSLGTIVCYDEEEGEKYAQIMAKKEKLEQVRNKEALMIGIENYERAVDITVKICEGIFISDLYEPEKILRPIVDDVIDDVTNPKKCKREWEIEESEQVEEEEEQNINAVASNESNNSIKYTICLGTVEHILASTIPWANVKPTSAMDTKIFNDLQETLGKLEIHNGHVYIYELLNSSFMSELFHKYYRFKVKYPKYIIADIIGSMPKNSYCD